MKMRQLISAPCDWKAVYIGEDGEAWAEPLIAWALTSDDGGDDIQPIVMASDGLYEVANIEPEFVILMRPGETLEDPNIQTAVKEHQAIRARFKK